MAESSQSSLSFERNLHPFLLEMYKIRIGDPYAPMHDLEAELSKRPDLQRCDAKEFCESWAVAKLTENIAAKPLTPEELTLEAAELLTDACNRRFGHSGESAVAGILKLISERCVAEARARRPAAIVDRVGSSFKTILAIGTALIFAGAFWESVKGDVAAAVTQASSTFHGLGRQFAPLTWWDGAILVAVVLFGTVLGDAVLETGASANTLHLRTFL